MAKGYLDALVASLYGVASIGPTYAAVFHDDLIPFEQFRDIHCNSPILSLYFRAYWSHEFWVEKLTNPVAATNFKATHRR
ncbi:hypothetical protein B0H16DRAFT_1629293 [Mycena metata]|uniref:Uncharacterized protein n=1 Tax=Mycena metata TaxID=1033252 RepID=A0AAD7H3A6_9AGAR|nr:hypothetical protein B0H16DRAFT_1629293 [Mycena metata]